MKQIPILSGRCLVVELPEGAHSPVVTTSRRIGYYDSDISKYANLPPGNWRIIGMLSEVRESEASKLVKYTGLGGYVDSYENYQNRGYLFLPTAIKSLESSILAEGYYLDENPIAVPDFSGGNIRFSETVEYAKAQPRVLDRERCLLLEREG